MAQAGAESLENTKEDSSLVTRARSCFEAMMVHEDESKLVYKKATLLFTADQLKNLIELTYGKTYYREVSIAIGAPYKNTKYPELSLFLKSNHFMNNIEQLVADISNVIDVRFIGPIIAAPARPETYRAE